jgi:hypothetical protein
MMNEGRDMSTILATMAANDKAPIVVRPGARRSNQRLLPRDHCSATFVLLLSLLITATMAAEDGRNALGYHHI